MCVSRAILLSNMSNKVDLFYVTVGLSVLPTKNIQ